MSSYVVSFVRLYFKELITEDICAVLLTILEILVIVYKCACFCLSFYLIKKINVVRILYVTILIIMSWMHVIRYVIENYLWILLERLKRFWYKGAAMFQATYLTHLFGRLGLIIFLKVFFHDKAGHSLTIFSV